MAPFTIKYLPVFVKDTAHTAPLGFEPRTSRLRVRRTITRPRCSALYLLELTWAEYSQKKSLAVSIDKILLNYCNIDVIRPKRKSFKRTAAMQFICWLLEEKNIIFVLLVKGTRPSCIEIDGQASEILHTKFH